MLEKINGYNYSFLKTLAGKRVHFISDCELFPNFDVTVKVIRVTIESNKEVVFHCLNQRGKNTTIGSNMKNLRFEIL